MSESKVPILSMAFKEALAEVKLGSLPSILLTFGSSIGTLIVTYFVSQSFAISAGIGIAVLIFVGFCVFLRKLFSIPMRLLNEANAKLAERDADESAAPLALYPQLEPHDIDLFNRFTALITANDIAFFEGFHFGDHIPRRRLQSLQEFYRTWDMPQHTFLSDTMNAKFNEVKHAAEVLMTTIAQNTTVSRINTDSLTVRTETDPLGQSEQTKAEIAELNAAATAFATITKDFHILAMRSGFRFNEQPIQAVFHANVGEAAS